MKRIGFLYEQIVSVENCKLAIQNASRHKGKRQAVKEVMNNLDTYAQDLSERLIRLDFLSPYRTRIIKDGLSGKERELQIPAFYPDQCAHHAIVQILQPIFLKSSYLWSCANIPNRGIDHACKGVERATVRDKKHAKYCVKMDISKFYPSIPHDKLKERLREKIKDEKALQILFKVIDSHSPGIPIGNYTSP
jgi:retron-type reverse transcriptase